MGRGFEKYEAINQCHRIVLGAHEPIRCKCSLKLTDRHPTPHGFLYA